MRPRIDWAGDGVVDGVYKDGRVVFHRNGYVVDKQAFCDAFGYWPGPPDDVFQVVNAAHDIRGQRDSASWDGDAGSRILTVLREERDTKHYAGCLNLDEITSDLWNVDRVAVHEWLKALEKRGLVARKYKMGKGETYWLAT